MKKLWIAALVIAAPLLLSGEARAQDSSWYSSVYQGYSNNRMLYNHRAAIGSSVRRSAGRRRGGSTTSTSRTPTSSRRPTGGTQTPPANIPVSNPGTTFLPVASTILPQQLADSMAKTPADRERIEKVFMEMLGIYEEAATRSGAWSNDVARATSYLINSSYHVYTDGRGMSDRQFAAMRDAIRAALLEDNEFQRLSMREKQIIYEDFAISGSFVMFGYQVAQKQGNAKALAELRAMAKQNLERVLGAPADKISFTDAGIQYR